MRRTLGKVPTYALLIVAVVLIAAIVVLMEWKLIRPQKEELAQLQEQLAAEEQVAAQRSQAEDKLAEVQVLWLASLARMEELYKSRSFPISMYQPYGAMIAMWYEYREDLPRVTKDWIASTGIVLTSTLTFPAPDMGPPSVPDSGFLAVPGQFTTSIAGTLQQIQHFYHSLGSYERIATISGLKLSGEGDALRAEVPLAIYLLVETPAVAASPAASPPGDDFGMPDDFAPPEDPGMGEAPPPPPDDSGDL
jgi:Tfp pilus assembly protein PilO